MSNPKGINQYTGKGLSKLKSQQKHNVVTNRGNSAFIVAKVPNSVLGKGAIKSLKSTGFKAAVKSNSRSVEEMNRSLQARFKRK